MQASSEVDLPSMWREPEERRVIWLTDLHLAAGTRYARRPLEQLDSLISHVREFYADADLLVITGDLVDDGSVEQYRALKHALEHCGIPTLLLIGNHDDRANFYEVFPAERGSDGFAQRCVDIGRWRLIGIDTVSIDGTKTPSYCEARARWLTRKLDEAAADGRRCVVFMHHPVERTQIARVLDDTVLTSLVLTQTLRRYRDCIELIAYGHVHRAIVGSWHGIPVCCNGGTSHQTIYQERVDALSGAAAISPPYGYMRLLASGVQVHLRSVEWEAAYRRVKSELGRPA